MTTLTVPEPSAAVPATTDVPIVAVSRRRIDQVLVSLGVVAAVVLAIAGGLLTWGSNFADDYVERELEAQHIFFPDAASLEEEGRTDLLGYAEQQVVSGKDAKAYASYIDHHLDGIADGMTYADLGKVESAAKAEVTAAKDANKSTEEVAALQAKADGISGQRNTLFKGETLRGLLLSTFAWWQIGSIAGIAAMAAFAAAAVMLILVVFGFVHMRRHHATV
ncbi:MAG: hypothetical protein AB7Q42_16335 [Acidimicrobiia bacterium]